MSSDKQIPIQLLLPSDLHQALELAAMNSGHGLSEEILTRLRSSIQTPVASTVVTDEDILAVTSKVALMAGRRGKIQQSDPTRRNGRKVVK